jgi:hypothetical protein
VELIHDQLVGLLEFGSDGRAYLLHKKSTE